MIDKQGILVAALMLGFAPSPLKAQLLEERVAACDRGSTGACRDAGAQLEQRAEYELAAGYYLRACDGREGVACANLARLVARGVTPPPFGSPDPSRAAALYQAACDYEYAPGCTVLGTWLERGFPISADMTRSLGVYRRGCDLGDPEACRRLGVAYERGSGVVPNTGTAAQYYSRGCDGVDQASCLRLAEMYELGQGISSNPARAAQLYLRGCEANDANACVRLGSMYEEGRGVSRDNDRAKQLYQRACEIGNNAACRLRFVDGRVIIEP